jgi:hypothetical protein
MKRRTRWYMEVGDKERDLVHVERPVDFVEDFLDLDKVSAEESACIKMQATFGKEHGLPFTNVNWRSALVRPHPRANLLTRPRTRTSIPSSSASLDARISTTGHLQMSQSVPGSSAHLGRTKALGGCLVLRDDERKVEIDERIERLRSPESAHGRTRTRSAGSPELDRLLSGLMSTTRAPR